MSEPTSNGKKFHWDFTIRIDTIIMVAAMLVTGTVGYTNLDNRTVQNNRDIVRVEDAATKATVKVETVLMEKITTVQAGMNQTQVRTADDVREIKQLMRDGFRDLDAKLDRKADKPTR